MICHWRNAPDRRLGAVGVGSKVGRRCERDIQLCAAYCCGKWRDFLGPGGWSGPGIDPRRGLVLALPWSPLPAYDHG